MPLRIIVPPYILLLCILRVSHWIRVPRRLSVTQSPSVLLLEHLVRVTVATPRCELVVLIVSWRACLKLLQVQYLLLVLRQRLVQLLRPHSLYRRQLQHRFQRQRQVLRVPFCELIQKRRQSLRVNLQRVPQIHIITVLKRTRRKHSQPNTEHFRQTSVYFLVVCRTVDIFLLHLLRG